MNETEHNTTYGAADNTEAPGDKRRRGWLRRALGASLLLLGKFSRLIYILLLTLLVLLAWLLFTTSGAQWLAERAMDEEPRLALTVQGGSLFNGLRLDAISWHADGAVVAVDSAETRWNLFCLMQLRVCLDRLHVDGVNVSLQTGGLEQENADDGDLAGDSEFSLPVTAVFPDIRLTDVDMTLDGQTVRWASLDLAGTLGKKRLRIDRFHTEGLDIRLPELPTANAAAGEQGAADRPAADDDAAQGLALPFAISLDDVQLLQTRVDLAGDVQELPRLELSLDLDTDRVHLRHLELGGLTLRIPDALLAGTERELAENAEAEDAAVRDDAARDAADAEFRLPFSLQLDHVAISDTRVFVDGTRQSLGLLRLSGQLDNGGLVLQELRTEDLRLNIPDWLLEATEATQPALAEVDPAASEPEADDGPLLPERIDLPFAVRVNDISLLRSAVVLQGEEHQLDALRMRFELDESLFHLQQLDIEGGRMALPEPTEPDPAADEIITDEGELDLVALLDPALREALELPELILPLEIRLDGIAVRDSELRRGDDLYRLERLDLALHGEQSALEFDLSLAMPELQANMDGALDLQGDYPLALALALQAESIPGMPELDPMDVALSLDGDLADLGLDLNLAGPVSLHLGGRLNVLDPAYPMDLELSWQDLGWPLESEERIASSEQGRITLRGDLNHLNIESDLALDGADIPSSDWKLAVEADYRGVDVISLRADLLEGSLTLDGTAGWGEGYHWDLALDWSGLNVAQLVAGAPETVSGLLRSEGRLHGDDLRVDAELVRLRTELEGQAVTASGRVSHRSGQDWQIHAFRADAADGHIALSGRVGDELALSGELDLPTLDVFLADLRGSISGTFETRGPLQTPDIDLALAGTDLGWAALAELESLELNAGIRRLGEVDSELRLRLGALNLPEQEVSVGSVSLALDGRQAAHQLRLTVADAPAELDLTLRGALGSDLAWDGTLEDVSVRSGDLALVLEQAVAVRWDPSREQALVEPHCWRHDSARLCAEERLELGTRGRAVVQLRDYDMRDLEPWLPEGVNTEGLLGLRVNASWSDDGSLPVVDALFRITDGRVRFESDLDDGLDPEMQELRYREFSVALDLDRDRLISRLMLDSEDVGQARINALINVDDNGELGAMDGELSLRALDLAVLEPFFLELRTLRGEITADGQFSGHARDPRFSGQLRLNDGMVETLALPVALEDIALQLDVRESRANLSGGFRSGDGRAEISGEADWSGESWGVNVDLRGERLDVAYNTMAALKASPDLQLRIRPREVQVSGRIEIPEGDITIRDLPASAVQVSDDVIVIDDELAPDESEAEAGERLPTAEGWDISTNIEIVLGNRIHLSGFGLTGRLTGNLRILQEGEGAPQGNGEINILDGKYRAYGKRLAIRQGQFVFAGPLDRPRILVEAVRDVSRYDVVAGLRVEGDPDDPGAILFSEPALPEEEILSYLLLGRPPGRGGEGEDVMVRAALALGIAGGAGTATAIAEGLGVQDFQIDTAGDGDDTQIMVGGYIGPNLFLSYGIGVFEPVNALTLRYELTNNLYLEAVSSLENALDLFYTFQF